MNRCRLCEGRLDKYTSSTASIYLLSLETFFRDRHYHLSFALFYLHWSKIANGKSIEQIINFKLYIASYGQSMACYGNHRRHYGTLHSWSKTSYSATNNLKFAMALWVAIQGFADVGLGSSCMQQLLFNGMFTKLHRCFWAYIYCIGADESIVPSYSMLSCSC